MNPFDVRLHPVAVVVVVCLVTATAVALTTKDLIERVVGR